MKREISKTPVPPPLTPALCDALTQVCFMPEVALTKVDVLFVFGTPVAIEALATHVNKLLSAALSDQVIIAGGQVQLGEPLKHNTSESRLIHAAIPATRFPKVHFTLEEQSLNTLENVKNALPHLQLYATRRIGYVFPAYGARRGYLTLRRFLPEATLLPFCFYAHCLNGQSVITHDRWHLNERARSRVWGEYLRIKCYGERGDIAYGQDMQQLVQRVESLLSISSP